MRDLDCVLEQRDRHAIVDREMFAVRWVVKSEEANRDNECEYQAAPEKRTLPGIQLRRSRLEEPIQAPPKCCRAGRPRQGGRDPDVVERGHGARPECGLRGLYQ